MKKFDLYKKEDGDERVLRTTTIAAQPYPVTEIVPRAFSEVYIKRDLENNKK